MRAEKHPIQVAHVAGQLDVGGMEKLLVEFARHADRERFSLTFISLSSRGPVAKQIEACGWPVVALDCGPGRRVGVIFRLARLFRRSRIDVVHTHNSRSLLYGAPAARLARIARVIHTRHGQLYGASPADTRSFRWASWFTDQVVCVSDDSARLSLSDGIAPRRVRTIVNGVDPARFAFLGPADSSTVVAVGRLSPEKGFDTLIEAIALASAEYPLLRLELAGDGPCLPELRRRADRLGISDRVSFLGEVADVPAVLARAALFVLPSLTEGISLTLLEAMARGLPVVATAVGGTPEVVIDGETGRLAPPRAPAELARMIVSTLGDPDGSRRMGLAGRRRVETYFDVRKMVASYERLYQAAGADGHTEAISFGSFTSPRQPAIIPGK
ncbi:MAG TPA: glycosyltransferase [Pirellulales bacterium]|nr:glycosyltransferase [Pirellulales bacterium]